ncbi:hypothetical protein [Desulfoferrobacter suflitae]|uniref:hypothetical protein n=1 Tax=Desulfoferrobacter suflitae TaxID=2865782 RepID=UPI002164EE16|nr:hypothetical protein [Desulfoferrobacter suflitae]MCK8601042.1 hypothetical protein [Desulfoferrobacter suflitae]
MKTKVALSGAATSRVESPRDWLLRLQPVMLKAAIPIMLLVSALFLTYEFWRLLSDAEVNPLSDVHNAIDLKLRYWEVHLWFAAKKSSAGIWRSVYQPASFVMLWPFMGWLSLTAVRWLWAATTVAMLVWLVHITVRESGAVNKFQRRFMALLPLSMYATGATIGNGQLIVHILPMLLTGLLILRRQPASIKYDLPASLLILFSLVKASIGAPFFWMVMFMPGRLRPAIFVAAGYLLLTLIGITPLEAPTEVMMTSVERSYELAAHSTEWGRDLRVADLAAWMRFVGLKNVVFPVSAFFMGLLGLWLWRHRAADFWVQCGVTGIWTRLLAYHRWYDDLLLLPAMIALFRLAHMDEDTSSRRFSGILFALMVPAMLAPGTLYVLPTPMNLYVEILKSLLWMTVLVHLMMRSGAALVSDPATG